jgi:hypothetical protein
LSACSSQGVSGASDAPASRSTFTISGEALGWTTAWRNTDHLLPLTVLTSSTSTLPPATTCRTLSTSPSMMAPTSFP